MNLFTSEEQDEIEIYGMTGAELDKIIKDNGQLKALRFYMYETTKAFGESNYKEAERAFNRVRRVIDVWLYPE